MATSVIVERAELLVIINAEDHIVRVYENTEAAQIALTEWITHDRMYSNDEVSDDDYRNIDEWMTEKGIKAYTTESDWSVLI